MLDECRDFSKFYLFLGPWQLPLLLLPLLCMLPPYFVIVLHCSPCFHSFPPFIIQFTTWQPEDISLNCKLYCIIFLFNNYPMSSMSLRVYVSQYSYLLFLIMVFWVCEILLWDLVLLIHENLFSHSFICSVVNFSAGVLFFLTLLLSLLFFSCSIFV